MEDNIQSVYNKLVSFGYKGTEDDFRNYISDDANIPSVYDKFVSNGYKGTEDDFRGYIGMPRQQQPAPRVDVSDVEAQQQTQVPTVTMEQVDNEPKQPYGDLTAENFVTMQQRGKELADQRKRIQQELDNDTEMEPLTVTKRKEYESQLRGLDEELRGVSSWMDEWNKTEGARAYYDQQKRAVDDVSARIDQMQADRNRERINKNVEEDNKKSWWRRMAEGLASAENPITAEVVEAVTDTDNNDLRAARNEVRNAKNQLRLEEMRQNGEQRGLGFLRGMENANYYELMPAVGMADAMSILQLSQDIKDGKELTDSQKLLKEAMEARAGVDFAYEDNNNLWERIGQSAPEQLMFTAQFVVGAGLTGATKVGEKVAAKSAERAVKRLAKKEATSAARNFVGTRVVPELEGMAVSSAIQTFSNPLSVAGMVEDFEKRYAGDIYYDKQGNLHVFDNDRSAGQAAYQAIASAWIENFTEYAGGNITKSAKLLDSKMFDLAGKFDNVMKTVGAGKIQDVFRIPQQLGRLTQIGSAPEEFLEEELGSVMNALMGTDAQRGESYGDAFKNTISSSFAGEQQLETFLSCAITSMLLGGGGNAVNGVRNAGLRKSVNQDVEQSKALLGKVRGVDIEGLDNMIENGRVNDISVYLKEQSDANNWNKDEQGAAVSYVLNRSRQIGVKHNDDTAIEAEQAEYRRQAEQMVNRWDGQNIYNVTYTDRNGETQEGTIVNGRVHYNTNEDGSYTFDPYMSSGMLAIRRADGSVEQVAGRNVTALNNVMSLEEQLESQNQTIDQMLRGQFEQDGMLPTIESVWGGNLVPNVTQFQNGRYTYLEQDDNGLYAFANNDKKTSKDNPIVYLTERQLVEYGLSLNLENAQANGDTEAAQKAQEDIDFLKRLDEITADAGAKGQWDVLKAYAQRKVLFDNNNEIIPDGSNEQATAAYLLAISEGSFENAIASVDQTIAALGTPQQTEVTDNAADNAAMNNAAATVDADKARQIDFYTNVRNRLTEMQQGKEEADQEEAEQVVANTPVSQMEVGQQFPVEWKGQQAMATVMGKDADGRSVVTVRDMDGEDIEAGIDDMSDAQWEAVRVQPQEATAPEQVPPQAAPQAPEQVEPQQEVPQAEQQQEETPQPQEPQLPRDKDGNIDYEQISDPVMYAQGLHEEFGDEAIDTINELIAEENENYAKATEKKNAIERRRAQKESQGKLDFYYKVKDALTPQEQVETPTEEAAPVEEAPIEQPVAEAPVEEAQPEQAPEQEATEESEPIAEETVEEQPSKPTEKEDSEFQKRIAAVGEPRNLEEAILMDIALGGAKFRWGNRNEDKKVLKRGIGDLWKYDNKEFRKRIGIVKKDGFSIETYAEAILAGQLQPYSGAVSQQAEGMDFQDIVAAIEDVLQMVTSKTGALQALEENRQAEAEEEQRYIRSLQDKEARDMGFEDWEDYENYQKSLEENNLTDDDYEEINRIFAEQTQEEDEQRARTSESEGDTAANQSDEQQGVRGESEGGTGVLQGTQVTDTGATEPTGQSTRSESGDTTNAAPQGEGADEVRAEIDRLKAKRANIVAQRNDIQQRYEQANGLFGDTQADESNLFPDQNFLSPELAQATIDGYNRQIKQIDEQIAKLEASLKSAEGVTQTEIEEAAEVAPANGGNTIFTEDEKDRRIEALKRRHRSQLNIAINPKDMEDLLYMAGYHIERGVRKFADFCKNMIEDLGDWVRPYLQTVYLGAKGDEDIKKLGIDRKEWSGEDEVLDFDVENFDRTDRTEGTDNEVTHQYTDKQKKDFSEAVTVDMRLALERGEKPYKSINDIRRRAESVGIEVDKEGRDDILLQELVEDGLVRAARQVIESGRFGGAKSKEAFDAICKLYEMQPTISMRSSNRVKMQQYSTPLPMAFVADMFAWRKGMKSVLEPTAGNGMLVFAIPNYIVTANELDETRLDNLRLQKFDSVLNRDALDFDFSSINQFDAVIANPPFGSSPAKDYDGKMISGLDEQITLNALSAMKDDGRAAIIIGGNMEYGKNGGVAGNRAFWTYLYDHYNVKGVVDMEGKLYGRQGTTYPTRMILIDGRRSEEERAQTAVYPPVKGKAVRKAESFDDLYDIVTELLSLPNKTNGNEVLRDKPPVSDNDNPRGDTGVRGHSDESDANDSNEQGGTVGTGSTGAVKPNATTGVQRTKGTSGSVDAGLGLSGVSGTQTSSSGQGQTVPDSGTAERPGRGTDVGGSTESVANGEPGRVSDGVVSGVGDRTNGVGLTQKPKEQEKRTLTEEKLSYRPHNSAFSLESVAPTAMVEAMDESLAEIEKTYGKSIDEFVRGELGYATIEELHDALAAEQVDSVAMAIHQMKQGQAMIIGDQTGVGKGRQMAALIRWAHNQGKKPIFITKDANLFSDIYRDLVDVGSSDLKPFIFNKFVKSGRGKDTSGEMVDADGNLVYSGATDAEWKKAIAEGKLPDGYDYAVLTYSQVNTGDKQSRDEAREAAKSNGGRGNSKKKDEEARISPKAPFLRQIAKDNYLLLDESHSAAGDSNTGAFLQSIVRGAKGVTFASATFAKRPNTMPLYAIRTAMSKANVKANELINIIKKGGVTLQEIMSRALTQAGQMVRRERDMSDVKTDWITVKDDKTVAKARENYDKTIAAFNAIIKFQNDYVKPMIAELSGQLAATASSADVKKGTDNAGVDNVQFASKTYNYTKQLMLALKVDAIVDKVVDEIEAGRHPVIALESTMESFLDDYAIGDVIKEPTLSLSLLKGLDSVLQYTITDEDGHKIHQRYTPEDLGEEGAKAYYDLQDLIRKSTEDIFISPLDAIISKLNEKGYKVGELTGRNTYLEYDDQGRATVRSRTDKDKKRMQRDFNSGNLDVLILNKSASTGISLHASKKFSDQRQRTMVIAQPLSDINDYMQMIGRIDRTGQVHRGYYINLGLPVPAENRFLMMLATKLKSLNANTTTSQESESNSVEAPDLLNKYGSKVVVEYLRDNPEIYVKMGEPLGKGKDKVTASKLDDYEAPDNDEVARKITGRAALLTTKEQDDFYNDVVKRYNDLIKYLDDTGTNDLKITVMPLKAKTLEKKVSSEGVDPNGSNPFAKDAYVETVEMDVLRKPMKADDVRKTIEQLNTPKGTEHGHLATAAKEKSVGDRVMEIIGTVQREAQEKLQAENERYEEAKKKAVEDIEKQRAKINKQQKRTEEEKAEAIEKFITDTNTKVEEQHQRNVMKIEALSELLEEKLTWFKVGGSYLMPDVLESESLASPELASPAIFCGYKAKDSKITSSTTFAVFATLDGRRRIEVKLSDNAAAAIGRLTSDNYDIAQEVTLDNWDSKIPTNTRKTSYIMTGNILQAVKDTQDPNGNYPGQLVSYTDEEGNVHDGILMPDKWKPGMMKSSGKPINFPPVVNKILNGELVKSTDGKVSIYGSGWAKTYTLTVPKTKKEGGVYFENPVILKSVSSRGFWQNRGEFRADINGEDNMRAVVNELANLGVRVSDEQQGDGEVMYRELEDSDTIVDNADAGTKPLTDREKIAKLEAEPKVKVYRSMVLIDGKLYPPMSSKEAEGKQMRKPSELGKWEEADEAPDKAVQRKGKWVFPLRKDNGKMLYAAYNPYIHTSRTMLNDQFSEAQSRPNLVVVEMEIPESELNANYKAEKAKDSVGAKQWKAGVIQGQLSGTREVILTRWAKPVRIVPNDEVAENIAKQIEGQVSVMPSNVVTPQVREALEARGVQFVETDNTGRLTEGEYAGETWASVYGKKKTQFRDQEREYAAGEMLPITEGENGYRVEGLNDSFPNVDRLLDAWRDSHPDYFAEVRDGQLYVEPWNLGEGSTAKERRRNQATAERQWRRAHERANDTIEKLGLQDRVTILDSTDGLTGKRKTAKGWFDPKTGKIVIVMPNHNSPRDVVKTILHEGVAHYGLRKLVGNENMNDFLDKVFENASEEVRSRIIDLAMDKYNRNFRTATEEYLAGLAEDTNFEDAKDKDWFKKIKGWFIRMLHKVGISLENAEDFVDTINDAPQGNPDGLTDNELRYLLWKSYRNLVADAESLTEFARDAAMQSALEVGNFAPAVAAESMAREENDYSSMSNEDLFVNLLTDKKEIDNGILEEIIRRVENDMARVSRIPKSESGREDETPSIVAQAIARGVRANGNGEVWERGQARKAIKQWAKDNGYWYDEIRLHEGTNEREGGAESRVFVAYDYSFVRKLTQPVFYNDSQPVLESLEMFGDVFRDTAYTIKGFGENEFGQLCIVTEQPFITGDTLNETGLGMDWIYDTLGDYMESMGFERVGRTSFKNDKYTVYDINANNVIIDENGDLFVIDAGVKLTKNDDYDNDDILFRDAEPANRIADDYNRMTGANVDGVSDKVRIKEELLRSFFDGLRSLEQMEKLIAKTLKRELRDSEKAYELATQTSSVSADMLEREETERLTPMIDKFTNMVKWLMDEHGISREEAQEKANNYMLAKHGLERNAWFEKQGKDEGDYAGLTGLAKSIGENPDDYKAVAENIVSEFERMVGNEKVNEFWDSVNDFTHRMLEISYDSGMIDKDTFEDLQKRHKYYIPLRGFADGTASDLFDYITKAPQFQDIFKKAKGRKSKADDPLSNLYNMMQSAIVIGNQNKVMQSIYRLAVNSNSDLLRITKPWYVYNDTNDTWEEKFPDIPEGATADETDAIVKQFEADMAQLKANGKAKRKLNRLDVGKKVLNREKVEHRMIAYINGQRVAMFVNGNPLVAQALNRANTNQLGVFAENMQGVTRIVSMINTSLSPAFMLTNSARDIGFALFSAMVTGGFKKTGQMAAWMATSGWVIPRLIATGKLDKGLVNKIGKQNADQIAQWWQEFTQNGGETGFMKTLSAEKARAQVNDMITHMLNGSKDGKNRLKKATLDVVTTAGRWSEDISRFAAYCWSRSQGNSVMESVNEAKNVTVNFNVKGGGNSTIARIVAGCRACYSFFNAALQGINRMARLAKEHPKAFITCLMACVLQGFLLPWLNMLMFTLLGGDDDDWEKYKTLTEYTANHNFVLYVGDLNPFKKTKGKFIKIPYSQELAPFAAIGNIFFRQQMGWNNGRSVADQIASMFIDLSPVSVGESKSFFGKALKTVTPTLLKPIAELGLNEDFTASPIYKKNQWNKYDAGWEKAYEGKTPGWLIDGSRWLEQNTNGWIDINPAAVEHLFSGMLGGIGRSGDKLVRFVSNGFQLQDAPFIRTMMFDSNPKGYIGAVQREYGRNAYEVLPKVKHDVDDMDAMEFARFSQTEEFEIANLVSVYKTGKDLAGNKKGIVGIDKMEKEYKKMAGMSDGSEAYREQLEATKADITELKMEMLDEIQQIKYEHSGELRKRIMDRVNEVEQKSKEKYKRRNGEEE